MQTISRGAFRAEPDSDGSYLQAKHDASVKVPLSLIWNGLHMTVRIEPLVRQVPLAAPISEEDMWEQPEAPPGLERGGGDLAKGAFTRTWAD